MTRSRKQRIRELASDRRAGAWLRRRSLEQQYREIRENRRLLPTFLVLGVILIGPTWLLPDEVRDIYLGAAVASVGWFFVLTVWQLSGVAYLQQGADGEQRTVWALRDLARSGEWRLVNHVLFKTWDVDHVLIGPAGVVVLETKGGTTNWAEKRQRPRILDAARQARQNAGDTRRFLRPDLAGAPVYSAVVLWPSNSDFVADEIDGTAVLSGDQLRAWVEALPGGMLDSDGVHAVWTRLSDHLERRDQAEATKMGPAPRRPDQWLTDTAQYPIGACAGFLALAQIARFGAVALLVGGLLLVVVAALVQRTVTPIRRVLIGVVVGVVATLVVVAGILGAGLLGIG